MSKYQYIQVVTQGDVTTLTLDRPSSKNALTSDMMEEMTVVIRQCRSQPSCRVLVIKGNGGVFCAGGDIKAFKAVFQDGQNYETVEKVNAVFGNLAEEIQRLPQVVVVMIEGAAIAGGMGLACLGDVTVATRDTQFGLSETTLGIPPAQIAPIVSKRIGASQAKRLMVTAMRFKADQALDFGIVHEVVEDSAALLKREAELVTAIRKCAPKAISETKEIIRLSEILSQKEMIGLAARSFAKCMLDEEGREGVSAFLEKRRPAWQAE